MHVATSTGARIFAPVSAGPLAFAANIFKKINLFLYEIRMDRGAESDSVDASHSDSTRWSCCRCCKCADHMSTNTLRLTLTLALNVFAIEKLE